jgi:hypothetical protein
MQRRDQFENFRQALWEDEDGDDNCMDTSEEESEAEESAEFNQYGTNIGGIKTVSPYAVQFESSYEKQNKKARTDVQGNSSREKALECHESKKKPAADASKSRGLEIGEGVEDEKSKSGTLAAKPARWTRKASRRKKIYLPAAAPKAEMPSYDQEVIDLTGDP